jgi:hypothetical protein
MILDFPAKRMDPARNCDDGRNLNRFVVEVDRQEEQNPNTGIAKHRN